jgi:hypothetical protein
MEEHAASLSSEQKSKSSMESSGIIIGRQPGALEDPTGAQRGGKNLMPLKWPLCR